MSHTEWIEYLQRANGSKNFEQIKNYYMSRKLKRFIRIDRKILEQKKDVDFVVVQTENDFDEKCRQNPDRKSIHYLIGNKNHFIWQKSSGAIWQLNEYLIKEDEESIDEAEIFHKNNGKVLIISAEPGMGKSLILDHLAQNSNAQSFCVKIVLNSCKEALKEENFDKNNNNALDFVLKSLLNKSDDQEIALLKRLAKEEKLILMFDGLDEVNDSKEQVIQLIDALNKSENYRILLTTRNHLKPELEDHFKTFSFDLNNFDDDDQKSFLFKYWRSSNLKQHERATSAKLKQSAEELIKKIKSLLSENINQLIGIPLQTKMLADIFIGKEKDSSKLDIANIADLYAHFLETKIKIQFEEKSNLKIEQLPKKLRQLFEIAKNDFYSDHIKLSSILLLDNNSSNKTIDLDEEKIREILEYGVVVGLTNKTPSFLHQSFAEFFLAKSSFQKLIEPNKDNKDKELEQTLRDQRHFLIRKFLNDLMERQQCVRDKNNENFTQEMQNCCRENLVFLLKYFIQQNGVNLRAENDFLIIASEKGSKNVVSYLLEQGIDVNQQGKWGTTALMKASHEGKKEIVQILLANKSINVNQQDKEGMTALMEASKNGQDDIVQLLLQTENIDVNQQDENGKSALMWAAEELDEEIVQLLLQNENIDVNQQDEDGESALLGACLLGHTDIVHLLLDHKDIEINQQDSIGTTALMKATIGGYKELVQLLVKQKDLNVDYQGEGGVTALMLASKIGHEDIVQLLLEQKDLNVNLQDENGVNALMLASSNGRKEIAQMLQEKINKK